MGLRGFEPRTFGSPKLFLYCPEDGLIRPTRYQAAQQALNKEKIPMVVLKMFLPAYPLIASVINDFSIKKSISLFCQKTTLFKSPKNSGLSRTVVTRSASYE